ncbi:unnamed protein product [Ixodes persulcatus]
MFMVQHLPQLITYFSLLNLPCFYSLFLPTVAFHHFWCSEFKTERVAPCTFRNTTRYEILRIYTHYGESIRSFYVPKLFNELPDNIFLTNSNHGLKKSLKKLFHDTTK